MSRLYYPKVERGDLASGGAGSVDIADSTKKIAKLIPVELVTAYAALVSASMVIRWPNVRLPLVAVCFLVCWVLTPIYLNIVADPGKPKRNQIIVGSVAFPIWAYLISASQVIPDYYDPSLAAIGALLFSLVTTVIPMNR